MNRPRPLAWMRAHPLMLLTVLAAAVAHASALLLFDVAPAQREPPRPPKSFLSLARPAGQSDVLRDQALLLDSAPLFLPTFWNTAPAWQERVETLPDPNLFEAFPDEVMLAVEDMRPEDGGAQRPRVDVAATGALPVGAGLAGKPSLAPLPPRSAFFEIRRLSSAALVASGTIEGDAALSRAPVIWQPAEFLVQITPEGMLGLPLQSHSAGSDEIDTALRLLVMRSAKLRTLPPGYYAVTIGP